jgi:hypothetical protein
MTSTAKATNKFTAIDRLKLAGAVVDGIIDLKWKPSDIIKALDNSPQYKELNQRFKPKQIGKAINRIRKECCTPEELAAVEAQKLTLSNEMTETFGK